MIRIRFTNVAPHAEFVWALTVAKKSRNGESPACSDLQAAVGGLQKLNVAHVGARDLDGCVERLAQQKVRILGLRETREDN
jgi:hypothetical protein